ncbi:MAG: hypothetical protein R2783_01245 [Gelidibacter sp.]
MTKFESGEQKTMLCIAKFDGKDTMQFAMGLNDIRPVDFEGEQTIQLTSGEITDNEFLTDYFLLLRLL